MKRISIIMLLFLSFIASAQENKTLTLKDALTYALENKADAKKAKLEVENSDYKITEVRSRALPQISANGNLTYNPSLQQNAFDTSALLPPGETLPEGTNPIQMVAFGTKWNSLAGVTLNQAIFDQAVFTGLKAAKTTREFYQVNSQLTEEQVIERVANNYYQVYVQRQKLNVLDSNYVNTEKVRNIIKGQFDNGLAKKIDLDRILVKLSNIKTQRQQALNAVQLQENALKFYMGMPIETKITIPQTAFEVTPSALSEKPNTTMLTQYKLLETQERLLTYQKKSIIAEYYPSLSLVGNFNYIGLGPEMPLFRKPEDNVYWSSYSSIGLNLKIPIFTGFSTKSRVQQADVALRSHKQDMIDTKLSLDLAYENSRTQIDNSIITIKNQKENVLLADEVLDNTRNNYVQGLASLTDLLDAENALTEAQNNYTTALLDYRLAEIQLVKSQGALKTLLN